MMNSLQKRLKTIFEIKPVRVYLGTFPGNPSNVLSCFDRLNASGSFLVALISPGLRSIILASQF